MTTGLSRCVIIAATVPQLSTAHVVIVLDTASAVVEARYEFTQADDSVTFFAIKLGGQGFRFLASGDSIARPTLAELPGLYSIRVGRHTADLHSIRLRYEITGDISRIPLPVPDIPIERGAGGVRIALTGVGSGVSLRDGFPRFTRESDGTAIAHLENLPGFVRLPPSQDKWSTNRLADAAVVLLVVAGTLYWLRWRRARSGTTS